MIADNFLPLRLSVVISAQESTVLNVVCGVMVGLGGNKQRTVIDGDSVELLVQQMLNPKKDQVLVVTPLSGERHLKE